MSNIKNPQSNPLKSSAPVRPPGGNTAPKKVYVSKCNSIGTNSHLCEKAKQSGLSCSKETDSTNLFGGDY